MLWVLIKSEALLMSTTAYVFMAKSEKKYLYFWLKKKKKSLQILFVEKKSAVSGTKIFQNISF